MDEQNPEGYLANTYTLATAGVPVNLPNISIVPLLAVTIVAPSGNGGIIYVAGSEDLSKDTSSSYPLAAGAEKAFYVRNARALWVNADTGGDQFILSVER